MVKESITGIMNQITNTKMSPSIADNSLNADNDLSSTQPTEVKFQASSDKNSPFIIQNGNIYQLNSNNQLVPTRNNISNNTNGQNVVNTSNVVSSNSNQVVLGMKSPTINASNINGTKSVILNTQQGNLNPKIKMTTIKNGTVLNLNTSNDFNISFIR